MEELIRTSGVCWLALAPISVVSEVITLVALHRHHSAFLSCDVILIYIVTSYMCTSLFVLFVPAVMYFARITWSVGICDVYTSVSLILRTSQILGILALCVNWAYSVRIFTEKQRQNSLRLAKWMVFILAALSLISGIVPYSGLRHKYGLSNINLKGSTMYYNNCRFLAYNLGEGYTVYFIVLTSFVFLVVLVITCDAVCMMRNMSAASQHRYQTGKYKIPRPRSVTDDVTKQQEEERTITLYDIMACLRLASDLSKVVILVTCFSLLLSHIPYMVVQSLQLFTDIDTQLLEVMTLWAVCADVIITPPLVWLSARRYRYFWTRPSRACPAVLMKGFVMRGAHNGTVRSSISPRTVAPEAQFRARSYMSDASGSSGSYDIRNRVIHDIDIGPRSDNCVNGHITTAIVESFDEDRENYATEFIRSQNRRSYHVNRSSNTSSNKSGKGVPRPRHRSESDERRHKIKELDEGDSQILTAAKLVRASALNELEKIGGSMEISTADKSRSLPADMKMTGNTTTDGKQSSARKDSPSRKVWIEKMRKKHLPAIFANDAFERENMKRRSDPKQRNTHKKNGSNTSLYYFCGEYHPDNLIGSLTGSLSKPEAVTDPNMAGSFTGSLTSPEVTIPEDEIMTVSLTSDITRTFFGEMYANGDVSNGEISAGETSIGDILSNGEMSSVILSNGESGDEYRSVDIDDGMVASDTESDPNTKITSNHKQRRINPYSKEREEHVLANRYRPSLQTVAGVVDKTDSDVTYRKPWWAVSSNPFSNDLIENGPGVLLSVDNLHSEDIGLFSGRGFGGFSGFSGNDLSPFDGASVNAFSNGELLGDLSEMKRLSSGIGLSDAGLSDVTGLSDTGLSEGVRISDNTSIEFDADVDRGFEEALDAGFSAVEHDDLGYALVTEVTIPKNMTSYNPFVNGTYSLSSSECSFATHAIIPKLHDKSENSTDANLNIEQKSKLNFDNSESVTDSSGYVDADTIDFRDDTVTSSAVNGSPWPNKHADPVMASSSGSSNDCFREPDYENLVVHGDIPTYNDEIPVYSPDSPVYQADIPVYTVDSPVYTADIPVYCPDIPVYNNESPVYTNDVQRTHKKLERQPVFL